MLPHGQRGTRERSQRDGFAFALKESMELGAAVVHAACKFRFRDVFTLHEFIELLGQLMQNALRELIGAVLKRKVQPRPSDCPRWARVTLKFSMGPCHMWTPPFGKGFYERSCKTVGCSHMSGLCARLLWPLALMISAD
jgi:hypothetical protein